jgi:queuine tRNA-ribosyltransferase
MSFSPIDEGIESTVSNYYTKAYLRHLFKAKEMLGLTIASIHNLAFYLWLVNQARNHILAGDFHSWKSEMVIKLQQRL